MVNRLGDESIVYVKIIKKRINLKIYHVEQLAVDYFFLSMNSGISRVQVYLKIPFYIFDLFLRVQSLRLSIVMSNVIRDTLYVFVSY